MSKEIRYIFPFDSDELLREARKVIEECNDLLERVMHIPVEEESDIRLIKNCGLYYDVIQVHLGVREEHQSSVAVATIECMQCPSADTYYIEASRRFLEEYNGILRMFIQGFMTDEKNQ